MDGVFAHVGLPPERLDAAKLAPKNTRAYAPLAEPATKAQASQDQGTSRGGGGGGDASAAGATRLGSDGESSGGGGSTGGSGGGGGGGGSIADSNSAAARKLRAFYAPHNARLRELLGDASYDW